MLKVGEVFGERFRVLGHLGRGAMGAVYAVEHTKIGRRFALKVLHPDLAASDEMVARFEREAMAVGAVGSPHIVQAFDSGLIDDSPFIVMELVEGESLAARLRAGPLAPELAVEVIAQVLQGLAVAHAAGVIHRDLKPDNVMLARGPDGELAVKILDFGISKLRRDARELTAAGVILGTPHYMAPEQVTAARDLDHRADLYSVGVMLYEALTGATPFNADAQTELLISIAYQEPAPLPPSRRVPSLPAALDEVVRTAMARDRVRRYETAEAFCAALAPLRRGAGAVATSARSVAATAPAAGAMAEGGAASVGTSTTMQMRWVGHAKSHDDRRTGAAARARSRRTLTALFLAIGAVACVAAAVRLAVAHHGPSDTRAYHAAPGGVLAPAAPAPGLAAPPQLARADLASAPGPIEGAPATLAPHAPTRSPRVHRRHHRRAHSPAAVHRVGAAHRANS